MITILPSAREDLANGSAFYEKQGSGLGIYFLESLFDDIDSLKLYAGVHPEVFNYHRFLAKRFPYAIYYSMDSGNRFDKGHPRLPSRSDVHPKPA